MIELTRQSTGLPNCTKPGEAPKYPPITVEECVGGSYRASYGAARKFNTEKAHAAPKADVSSSAQAIAV
jgi:hypothetical protein